MPYAAQEPGIGCQSGMLRALMHGLHCATLGILVVDKDRCPCVELLPDLEDFRRQRDVLCDRPRIDVGGSLGPARRDVAG
jgi:hypothetical protein